MGNKRTGLDFTAKQRRRGIPLGTVAIAGLAIGALVGVALAMAEAEGPHAAGAPTAEMEAASGRVEH